MCVQVTQISFTVMAKLITAKKYGFFLSSNIKLAVG